MKTTSLANRTLRERGQVAVIFALMLPMIFALSGVVVGIGNWYVHGKNLQTKADAGAFAGGDSWEFPCGPQTDARIDAQARLYAGSNNPQVGKVPNSSIHTVLNGTSWYDDDSNPTPVEYNLFPPNTTPCAAEKLDVKVTEDNSFPLLSLIPLFPDIKRRARIEIRQVEGVTGLLPIAVRAPEPKSAAAVYYNELNGNIYAVRYLVKDNTIGAPSGLQGWTTLDTEDSANNGNPNWAGNGWAKFTPGGKTGVLIAVSFRGACNTGLPAGNTKIITEGNPCFEDNFATVSALCNQGSGTQIVNCNYTTGTWPSETVQAGLQFIRGYASTNPGTGPPGIESAYLTTVSCTPQTPYFNAHPGNACQDGLKVAVNLGALQGLYPNPPPATGQSLSALRAGDVQVRWCKVTAASPANNPCNSMFGTTEDMLPGSSTATGTVTFSTQTGTQIPTTANSGSNAIAIEVQLRNAQNSSNPACAGPTYSGPCRYRYTATLVTTNDLTRDQILANPIQRAFRGNSLTSTNIQWLRLTTDVNSCGSPPLSDMTYDEAASVPNGGPSCFLMDIGLKGGIAVDSNDQPILFNDGVGASQMGAVDCDPNIAQGQILIDGIRDGCNVSYARHPFDYNPLCPSANNLFDGYPGAYPTAPWNDGRWPPVRCIKTRPTSQMSQLTNGFEARFFGGSSSCPPTSTGYVKGRNYWDKDTNNGYVAPAGEEPLGYKEGSHDTHFWPSDPRIVTLFVAPTEAFAGNGQDSYPITGFIEVYVTGYGRIQGNGSVQIDDPCPGSALPTDLDLSGGNTGGRVVWGHIINYALRDGSATPSDNLCLPGGDPTPCVPALVE
jgi:hypothetical protein